MKDFFKKIANLDKILHKFSNLTIRKWNDIDFLLTIQFWYSFFVFFITVYLYWFIYIVNKRLYCRYFLETPFFYFIFCFNLKKYRIFSVEKNIWLHISLSLLSTLSSMNKVENLVRAFGPLPIIFVSLSGFRGFAGTSLPDKQFLFNYNAYNILCYWKCRNYFLESKIFRK